MVEEYQKTYYQKNRERLLKRAKEYYWSNKEHVLKRTKEYRDKNRETINEWFRNYERPEDYKKKHYEWKIEYKKKDEVKERIRIRARENYRNNIERERPKHVFWAMKRHAQKLSATPQWADQEQIKMWYELAEVLSRSGVKFEVDHIVPLQPHLVCGLHTHDNMRVIPKWENISKHNKFSPGEHVWP